ncbi:MAG TPA: YifB family Mg chelatase-like AAA ATPase [Desulfomonilia bacterium]|nr:YifB family Mg chelatase-like AAA ATPase [Desulfomonilia bacterium]
MMASVQSATLWGTDALGVVVEADIQGGLPSISIVGLPDSAVKESRERVRSAIVNSGLDFPPRRITVNLAPADVRKEGGTFDLPVSVAILAALGLVGRGVLNDYLFMGELGLDGSVRPVRGVVSAAFLTKRLGLKGIICPIQNAQEAFLAEVEVLPVRSLKEVFAFIRGEEITLWQVPQSDVKSHAITDLDLSEISGQALPKRALEIAAAGGHNLLMVGPPGAGKSMLAKRLPTILPPLTKEEILECTSIYSAAGKLTRNTIVSIRPFRSPHHTISDAGLIGGGTIPSPGEVSLAHNGVLFLDELLEFRRSALESMRQPLEDGKVTVSRASSAFTFPASFQLVAALNPCPCGYLGHPSRECRCPPLQVAKYRSRLSGPLIDRIDLHVWVDPVDVECVLNHRDNPSSVTVRERVEYARSVQINRGWLNAKTPDNLLEETCRLERTSKEILIAAMRKYNLSMRGFTRVIKVARTIADLEKCPDIKDEHIAESLQFRPEIGRG